MPLTQPRCPKCSYPMSGLSWNRQTDQLDYYRTRRE